MEGILLIILCISAGKWLTHYVSSSADFISSINLVAIRVALPALIIIKIHAQPISIDALFPIIMPWVLFGFTALIVYTIHFFYPMKRTILGCILIMSGTGNTSFVGYPLITALMGTDQFLEYAIYYDQSNFILLFTLGGLLADIYTNKSGGGIKNNIINLFKFVPIQALIIALLLRPFEMPEIIHYSLNSLALLLTPLTMISVGASLRLPSSRHLFKPITIGLIIKLILLPAIMLGIIYLIAPFYRASAEVNQIVVMQAAMAPMVLGTIIAAEKNLEPELANLLTAIGIPISFITVSGWYFLSLL